MRCTPESEQCTSNDYIINTVDGYQYDNHGSHQCDRNNDEEHT